MAEAVDILRRKLPKLTTNILVQATVTLLLLSQAWARSGTVTPTWPQSQEVSGSFAVSGSCIWTESNDNSEASPSKGSFIINDGTLAPCSAQSCQNNCYYVTGQYAWQGGSNPGGLWANLKYRIDGQDRGILQPISIDPYNSDQGKTLSFSGQISTSGLDPSVPHTIAIYFRDVIGGQCYYYALDDTYMDGLEYAPVSWTFWTGSCNLTINSFTASATSFRPYLGETVTLQGNMTEATQRPVAWTISIQNSAGTVVKTFSGNGTSPAPAWDGKDTSGNPVAGGTYTVNLSAQTTVGSCSASASLQVYIPPCNLTISTSDNPKTTLDPSAGEELKLPWTVTETTGRQVSWTITVRDRFNTLIRTLSNPSMTWDGKKDNGDPADSGPYTVAIAAQTTDGQCTANQSLQVKVLEGPKMCLLNKKTGSTTNLATGQLSHSQDLFSLKGSPLPVSLSLSYKSLDSSVGSLGAGWSHNYEIGLTDNGDGTVLFQEGKQHKLFTLSGGSYQPQADDSSSLGHDPVTGTWTMTRLDGTAYHFETVEGNTRIASIADHYTNTLAFDYTVTDQTTIIDPAGRRVTFTYDPAYTPKRLSTITDPNQEEYRFHFDGNGRLDYVYYPDTDTGVNGNYWAFTYKGATNLLASKRDLANNTTYYYYNDTTGQMESTRDPEWTAGSTGHTRAISYKTTVSGSEVTTTFTEKDGGSWSTSYDTQTGAVTHETGPNGKVTDYYYNADANKTLKAKTVPFDTGKRLTTFYAYDSHGNVLYQTEPIDISTITPAIDIATVDISTFANPTSQIKWAQAYTYDYALNDRILTTSDLRGTVALTTRNIYATEGGGEVMTVVTPGNLATVTKYNDDNTLKEIIDAENTVVAGDGTVTEKSGAKKTTFTYYPNTDEYRTAGTAGLLQSVTGLDGVTTTYSRYDLNGNPEEVLIHDSTGALRSTTVNEYDAMNRLRVVTRTVAGLPDNVTHYDYDANGSLTVTDAELKQTRYDYTFNGQVKKVTQYKDGVPVETVYDYGTAGCPSCGGGVDKLTRLTDAKQHATGWMYDQLGRLERETDPLGKVLRYTYYDNGLVKEKYDATGGDPGILLVTYHYNERGQVADKNYTDGRVDHFEYRLNGALDSATTLQNGTTVISYSYDYYDDGRLKSVTDTSVTPNRTISYDTIRSGLESGVSRREQVTVLKGAGADERVISYDYDATSRPWKITSAAGTFEMLYDELGRRATLAYPNQVTATYGYDELGRLTSLTHAAGGTTIVSVAYPEIDQVGNRKAKTVNAAGSEQYLYDDLYRLLTVTAGVSEAFDYDAVGNRLVGPGAKDTRYDHDAANRMNKGRKLDYAYDDRGNQAKRTVPGVPETDKSWTQTWDNENRLKRMVKEKRKDGEVVESRSIDFSYDPFGRRIGKQMSVVKGGVTKTSSWSYVYDNDNIALEIHTDETGAVTKTFYTQGPGTDEHLAMERDGQFYYFHADGLGSIVAITDANKTIMQSYEYDSFGMVKPANNTFRNSYTYTGREWDKETGLYYYRARYYDPMEGRFISKDPIGFDGGLNLYNYVENNSINLSDPDGLCSCKPGAVVWAARSHEGERGWGNPGLSGGLRWTFEYKCNKFVNQVTNEAGATPPMWLGRPATAGEMANPNNDIPCWKVVTGPPRHGDIISNNKSGPGYSGHTGIVVGHGATASANSTTRTITINNWGFRAKDTPITIRRCTRECN